MRPISKCFGTFRMKHRNCIQYHIECCLILFVTSLHPLIKERNILIRIYFLIHYWEYWTIWPSPRLFSKQSFARLSCIPTIDIKKDLINLCLIQLNLI